MFQSANFSHKYILLFLSIFCLNIDTQGQETGRSFLQNFSPSEYNAYPQNWCVTQGENGLMYVGNNFGVLEFDGEDWRLIPVSNKSTVRGITVHQKTIYVGAQGEFGYLKSNSIGVLEYTSLSEALPDTIKEQFTNVWEVHSLHDKVFFRTDYYLFFWDGDKLNWIKSKKEGFHRSYIINEELWIVDINWGLAKFKDETQSLELVINGSFFKGSVYGILPYKNRVLIVTKKGVYDFDYLNDGKPNFIFSDLPSELIYQSVYVENEGYLFATLGEGLIITDLEGNIIKEITTKNGLPDNVVINLGLDHQKGVWLGLNNGVS